MQSPRTRSCPPLVHAVPLLLVACGTVGDPVVADVHELGAWLSGAFSNAAQAEADPAFFEVRVVATPIWTERDDGPWLYVEQATAGSFEQPYRQRIYHLVADDEAGTLRSDCYELPGNPLAFAGAWREPHRFDALPHDNLWFRRGCSIHFRLDGTSYTGRTRGTGCESSFAGATHATSRVVLTPDRLRIWERGFDATGQQVWGTGAQPYVFDRVVTP